MSRLVTDTLEIAYQDQGAGKPVLLLHGWPDDASAWDEVAAQLRTARLRTIMPTLRGVGEFRFRSAEAQRTGESAMHAMDMIALPDGIGAARIRASHRLAATGRGRSSEWLHNAELPCSPVPPVAFGL